MELGRTLLEEMSVHSSQILQESFSGHVTGDERPVSELSSVNVTFARSVLTIASSPTQTLLETAERDAIIKALDAASGNKSEAAELLGMGRTTLYRKLRQLGLDTGETSL